MVYQSCFHSMGTRLQMLLVNVDQMFGEHLQALVSRRVLEIEQAISVYLPDSPLTRANDILTSQNSVEIDDAELLLALHTAQQGFEATKGFYNASCGELVRRVKEGRPLDGIYAPSFSVQDENRLVCSHVGLGFDFGGLGKGIALDSVRDILVAEGIENALVSFGESSILGIGSHPHGDHWPIAVPDPTDTSTSLIEIKLRDSGLTLSSTLGNGLQHGEIRQHIVNPISGKVVLDPITTAVHCDSLAWGEMLSTASLVSGFSFSTGLIPETAGLKHTHIFKHFSRGFSDV